VVASRLSAPKARAPVFEDACPMTLHEPTTAPAQPSLSTQRVRRAAVPASSYARVAEGLLLAVAASVVAALPAAIRTDMHANAGLLVTWLAAMAPAAMLLGPSVALARAARPWRPAAVAALIGVGLATGPVMVLGRVLKASTHHRPLGAVTFSVVAAMVFLGAIVVGTRLFSMVSSLEGDRARVGRLAVVAAAALSPVAGLVLLRAAWADPLAGAVGYGLLDALLAVALGIVAGWVRIPPLVVTASRRFGPTLWVLVVLVGLWLADRSGIPAALRAESPILGWVLGFVL
jgi:hypothetical protein